MASIWRNLILPAGLLAIGAACVVAAGNGNGKPASRPAEAARPAVAKSAGPKSAAANVVITPAREAAAMTFARGQHPELADLLEQLKKSSPQEYQRALQDLYLASERLAKFKGRNQELYELSLESWRLDSQIRLLVARFAMTGDVKLETQLRELARARVELRLRQLKVERDQTTARLQKLELSIARIEADPQAEADADFLQVTESLGRVTSRQGKSPRPQKSNVNDKPTTGAEPSPPPSRPQTN